MSIKRVILVNNSRLLLEMFHRVLDKAEGLEVVGEVRSDKELALAIQRLCPDWAIISLPVSNPVLHWIGDFMQHDPSVRFVFLSPDNHSIKMNWQTAFEEDISNVSLNEFIFLLEKNVQPI